MRKAGCKNVGTLLSLQVLCLNGFYNKNFMGDNDRECRSRGTTPCSRSSNSSLSWGLAQRPLHVRFAPDPAQMGCRSLLRSFSLSRQFCYLASSSQPRPRSCWAFGFLCLPVLSAPTYCPFAQRTPASLLSTIDSLTTLSLSKL